MKTRNNSFHQKKQISFTKYKISCLQLCSIGLINDDGQCTLRYLFDTQLGLMIFIFRMRKLSAEYFTNILLV